MISGLAIDNMAVPVTGTAAQTIAINGGTITINAQTTSGAATREKSPWRDGSSRSKVVRLGRRFCARGDQLHGHAATTPPTQIAFGGGVDGDRVTTPARDAS